MSNKQFHGQISTVSEAVQAIGKLDSNDEYARFILFGIARITGQMIGRDELRPTYQRLLSASICAGFNRRDAQDALENYLTRGMAA